MLEQPQRIRVVIADDHPMYRRGLAQEISERPRLDLVAQAVDGTDAIAKITEHRPDVALVDLRMPDLDGTVAIQALLQAGSPTKVIVLSAFYDKEAVYEAMLAGAHGYLRKDADRDEICAAVENVFDGEHVLPASLQHGLIEELRLRAGTPAPRLSARERQVLELTAEGLTSRLIGERLYISRTTVRTHLERVYEKLGVSDRAAVVAEAMRRGLLR